MRGGWNSIRGFAEDGGKPPPVWCRIAGGRSRSKPPTADRRRELYEFTSLTSSSAPPAGDGGARAGCRRRDRAEGSSPRPARGPSGRSAPAQSRRRERRGLLVSRQPRADLPVDAPPLRLRPDLPHPRRRLGAGGPGLDRQGAHHLLLLHGRRPAGPLLLDPPLRTRLPAPPRPLPRLRLVDRPRLRDLHRPAGRQRPGPVDRQPRLRRRDHRLPQGRLADLHLDARRRPRPLPHGRRRQERQADHRHPRLRRRRLLLSRLLEDRLARLPPQAGAGARRVQEPARPRAGAPHRARDLDRQRRRQRAAAGHLPERRLLRAVVLPVGEADPLLVQLRRSQGARVRPLGDRRRRLPSRADHLHPPVRRLPRVLAGRHPPRLRLQPQRHHAGGDRHLRGPVGGEPTGGRRCVSHRRRRPLPRRRELAGRRRPRGSGDRHRRPRPGPPVARRPLPRPRGRAGGGRRLLRELHRPRGGRGPAGHRGPPRRRAAGGGRLPSRFVLGVRIGGGGGGRRRLRHHRAGPRGRRLQGDRRHGQDRGRPPLRPRGGRLRRRGRAPLRRPPLQGVQRPRARRQGGDRGRCAGPLAVGRRAGRGDRGAPSPPSASTPSMPVATSAFRPCR